MPKFSETKIFQVKLDKLDLFEEWVRELLQEQKMQPGCNHVRYLKRDYTYDTIDAPPRKLVRSIKAVKYVSYWEFDSLHSYHEATKWFFSAYEKRIMKCLIAPFDIYCGEIIE